MKGFDEFCDDDNDDAGVAPHPPADVPPVIGSVLVLQLHWQVLPRSDCNSDKQDVPSRS